MPVAVEDGKATPGGPATHKSTKTVLVLGASVSTLGVRKRKDIALTPFLLSVGSMLVIELFSCWSNSCHQAGELLFLKGILMPIVRANHT